MAVNIFGFTISREEKETDGVIKQSFITPTPDDGTTTVQAGGYFGTYLDLDATAKSESDMITRYREISLYPDCDNAIEEIVTQAIAAIDDEDPVKVVVQSKDYSDKIKKAIEQEFRTIMYLLDFKSKAHDIFRRWYIDGRVYYQKIIDPKNLNSGIKELRYIDPRKIRKVRDIKKEKLPTGVEIIKTIDEFYIYNEKGINYMAGVTAQMQPTQGNAGIRIAPDTVSFCPSGLIDLDKNIVIGYLHKAIKTVNQLKMMEDSLVIYRLSRAPERRIFYIDVGNLPKQKAEQYLKDIMTRYKNKIVYDSNTGEIKDDRKFMTILEDFWLPRREGGKGTEITTLPGGENLGQIADIEFFQNKMYRSLNVPYSRMIPQQGFNLGRAAEITREEMKFAKFVDRLRKKFNVLFDDLLRTQLILKGVITEQDWDNLKQDIQYLYAQDQYFEEMKEAENMRNRVDLLNQMAPYVGTYFSKNYIKTKVLRFDEEEIEQINDEMEEEIAVDADPNQPGNQAELQQGQQGQQPQPSSELAAALSRETNQ